MFDDYSIPLGGPVDPLFGAAPPPAESLAPVEVEGSDGDDLFYVRLDPGGTLVEIFASDSPVGDPWLTLEKDTLGELIILGRGGDDRLFVDLENGNPLPAGGIRFEGGAAAEQGNRITLMNSFGRVNYHPSAATTGDGWLKMERLLTFSETASIHVERFALLELVMPGGAAEVMLDGRPGDSGNVEVGVLAALAGGIPIAPISFSETPLIDIDLYSDDALELSDSLAIGASGVGPPQRGRVQVGFGGGSNTLMASAGRTTVTPMLSRGGTLSLVADQAATLELPTATPLSELTLRDEARLVLATPELATLRVDTLDIAPAAQLDLDDNDLIVHATPGTRQEALELVRRALYSGRAGGAWNGAGISSSAAAGHADHTTGLTAVLNDRGGRRVLLSSFGGHEVGPNDILIKYTFEGDLDLDGRITPADYALIDRGIAKELRGYRNGDIDHGGGIADGADLFLMDRAFLAQGGPTLRRGTVGRDAAGWTDVQPSRDSVIIYVSSSEGDDQNSGTSEAHPVRTLERAHELARSGMPDWIVLKRGDRWVEERFGAWAKSGRSPHEPFVLGAYGTGTERPIIQWSGGGGAFAFVPADSINHLVLMGIHFTGGAGFGSGPGIARIAGGDNFLMEDLVVERFMLGMSIQGYPARAENVTIRRSQIVDNRPLNAESRTQGIYLNNVNQILLEENLIDRNGWGSPDRADATLLNHNVYLSALTDNVVVRRNIIANASSHGLQARSGGVIQDNVFVRNPIGMSFGLVNGSEIYPGGVSGEVTGNVFLEAADIGDAFARGWGIEVSNIRPNSGTAIRGNIFAHDLSVGTFAAIDLGASRAVSNPQDAVGIRDLSVEGNIVYRWDQALAINSRLVPGQDGIDGYSGLVIRGNDFQWSTHPTHLISHLPGYQGAYETWANNVYHDHGDAAHWFRMGPGSVPAEYWLSEVDPAGRIGQRTYTDPDRGVGSYNATLGGASTTDAFLEAARALSRFNWDSQYLAAAVLAYIREGFSGSAVAPVPGVVPANGDAMAAMVVSTSDTDHSSVGVLAAGAALSVKGSYPPFETVVPPARMADPDIGASEALDVEDWSVLSDLGDVI